MEAKIDYIRRPVALVLMDGERTVSRLDLDSTQVVAAEWMVKEASGKIVAGGNHVANALKVLRDIDYDSVSGMRDGIEDAIDELSSCVRIKEACHG